MTQHLQAAAAAAYAPIAVPLAALDCGLPQERAMRIAARRVFVAMKRVYLDAASPLEGSTGARLRRRIRQAIEPADLLELHVELLDALSPQDAYAAAHRRALHRQLDEVFPDSALTGWFAPL